MRLFLAGSHEPLVADRWEESEVRARIQEIVAEAEAAFHEQGWWPLHPADEEYLGTDVYTTHSLWSGAAGMLWALVALERVGVVELQRDYCEAAARLSREYVVLTDAAGEEPTPPGLWLGEAGVLLVAELIDPDPARADRLHDRIVANARNPTLELMWGAPGTMLAAEAMLARTGEERWREAWCASADALLDAQDPDTGLWTQDLYGQRVVYLGPAHGFVGIVESLWRGGGLLDCERRRRLARRAVEVVREAAARDGGQANWPTRWGVELIANGEIRVQWCHGAPGIVCSLASLPADGDLDQLLLAGGNLTWTAGPLAKGPGLCHGTAGNGFAFLALHARTGDELWLERARAFALHALAQVERERERHGRGRFSLWTGDVGAAAFACQCLRVDPCFPTIGWW
ncbi:MAG: lanthionine synthetase C family protein [Gaiella sp.]